MTKEEKELLLVDLCARLPYKIKVKVYEVSYPVDFDIQMLAQIKNNNWYEYPKPYLRPMSSMTKEEKQEYTSYVFEQPFLQKDKFVNFGLVPICIDWLNKKMFDYHGLIEKGLAIEAPDNMYKEEQQ